MSTRLVYPGQQRITIRLGGRTVLIALDELDLAILGFEGIFPRRPGESRTLSEGVPKLALSG